MNILRSPLVVGMILLPIFLVLINRRKKTGSSNEGNKGTGTEPKTTSGKITPNGKVCRAFPNSRGIRNNNPGNLRISSNEWQGKIPISQNSDGSFEQFETWVLGLRAMIKLIRNYIGNGYDSINKIVNRYAPSSDGNNTNAYINSVVKETGILANKRISTDDKTALRKIIKAMVRKELGCGLVTDSEFNKAWDLL